MKRVYRAAGRGEAWALVLLQGAGGHLTLAAGAGRGPLPPAQGAGQLLTGTRGVPAAGARSQRRRVALHLWGHPQSSIHNNLFMSLRHQPIHVFYFYFLSSGLAPQDMDQAWSLGEFGGSHQHHVLISSRETNPSTGSTACQQLHLDSSVLVKKSDSPIQSARNPGCGVSFGREWGKGMERKGWV